MATTQKCPQTIADVAWRYPRVVAHVIAESLGYASPSCAANIVLAEIHRRETLCDWVHCCHGGDPRQALATAIQRRHRHKGFMAEYKYAKRLVDEFNQTGWQPDFASWF